MKDESLKNEEIIELVDSNGIKKKYLLLLVFKWFRTNKYYMVYTDEKADLNNIYDVYANIFDPKNLNNLEQSQTQSQNKTENYLLNSNSNTNINKNNYSLYQENIENNNKTITIPNEIEQENKYKLLSETYQPPSNNILKNIDIIENKEDSKNFEEEKEIKSYTNYDNDNKYNNQKQNLNNCILNENNYYENNKKKNILNEKDEEIKELQKRIEEQREIINKLKLDNNNLEELIEKDRQKKDELYILSNVFPVDIFSPFIDIIISYENDKDFINIPLQYIEQYNLKKFIYK